MGYSHWDGRQYKERQAVRRATGKTAFTHNAAMAEVPVNKRKTHELMNPHMVVRESRDSKTHPESNAIIVGLDVTGSMATIPMIVQEELGRFMGCLVEQNVIPSPQVMFAAIGDAYSDRAPLQVGQFETSVEMDDDLGRMYLEGNGGGQNRETYELLMYFAAHHTSIDCYEKRGKKGYLITIGDERAYERIPHTVIKDIFGREGEEVSLQTVVELAREKYHLFHIVPIHAHYGRRNVSFWQELLGKDSVIEMANPKEICEVIINIISENEAALRTEPAVRESRYRSTQRETPEKRTEEGPADLAARRRAWEIRN